jgi:hypothetical protein
LTSHRRPLGQQKNRREKSEYSVQRLDSVRKETPTRRAIRIFTSALNGAADRWNALVPILAVGIGVAIMFSIPPDTSWRLFKSEQERNDLFARFNFTQAPGVPLIVVAPNCVPCTTLLTALDGAKVSYTTLWSTDGGVGQQITLKANKELRVTDSPLVVLDLNLLKADLQVIQKSVPASR